MPSLKSLALTLLLATFAIPAIAQTSAQSSLVGTWSLVMVDNLLPDGSRVQLYGPDPKGIMILDPSGRYAMEIFRSEGRPKFAANDKSKGTPDEYKAAVQGSNAHFGTYTVNPDHTITFHIQNATFPNWEGTDRKSPFTLTGDELKVTVTNPTTGGPGVIGEVSWKRAPAVSVSAQ
jgi:hypothetical protein